MKVHAIAQIWMLSGCLLSQSAFAASELATARVSILPALTVSQQTEIDFGFLNNANGTCSMAANGQLSGSTGLDCNGVASPGIFSVSGLAGASVILTTSQATLPGITFDPAIAGGNTRLLVDGSTEITVIGTLTLDNTNEGDKDLSYTLTANYE